VGDYEKEGLPIYRKGGFASVALVKHECPDVTWAFAAERVGFLLDAEIVLSTAIDRSQHPVRDLISDGDVENLQNMLDEWAMSLRLNEFLVDEDRIVVFSRALFNEASKGCEH
jgi:hypothetical protein